MMIKHVRQTRFGKPQGNCYEACLAMVLGVSLDEVPDRWVALGEWKDEDEEALIGGWLRKRGLVRVQINPAYIDGKPRISAPGVPVILSGPSPRGAWNHAVVGLEGPDDWIFFDPHPDDTFIERIEHVELLVPLELVAQR